MFLNNLIILIASFLKLNQPSQKINHAQKTLLSVAPNIWNSLPDFSKQQRVLIPINYF